MAKFKMTPKRIDFLKRLELESLFDVAMYFPRRYNEYLPSTITSILDGQRVVIRGEVKSKDRIIHISKSLTKFGFNVIYNEDEYHVIVFNRPFFYPNIVVGSNVLVAGKLNFFRKEITALDIFTKDIESINIKPIYSLVENVTGYEFQQVVRYALDTLDNLGMLDNIIPEKYHDKYKLVSRKNAYNFAHFPKTEIELTQAIRYLKYEELLLYALTMQKNHLISQNDNTKKAKTFDRTLINMFLDKTKYILTSDQITASEEILNDIRSPHLMYRMLQGDVGTGKTLVAIIALLAIVSAGYQGALMAPTDILARQHYDFLTTHLELMPNVNIVLLVSAMPSKAKKEAIKMIESGKANIIIGTHALIQEAVNYHNLGLAIIDEQQRFGVNQRKLLREKGDNVELLMMTATPIPRSLAITLYGDMDVSTLKEFPNKKRSVVTKVLPSNSIKTLIPEMLKRVANNERIFLVCPLIEEDSERRNVEDVYAGLVKYFQNKVPVGLLHGKLEEAEKNRVMEQFQSGEIKVLVSTTVIEVGIDIQKASMMVIYDANSFGLAQIHQLRGRIGRSGQEAVCYLLCATSDEDALKRLKYLEAHEDGFDIARFDLQNRGPGDITGLRQSGLPEFNIANIIDDLKILELARDDAKEILANQNNPQNKAIMSFVETKESKSIAIIG